MLTMCKAYIKLISPSHTHARAQARTLYHGR